MSLAVIQQFSFFLHHATLQATHLGCMKPDSIGLHTTEVDFYKHLVKMETVGGGLLQQFKQRLKKSLLNGLYCKKKLADISDSVSTIL